MPLGIPYLGRNLVSLDSIVNHVINLVARRRKRDDLTFYIWPRRLGGFCRNTFAPPDLTVIMEIERDKIGRTENAKVPL